MIEVKGDLDQGDDDDEERRRTAGIMLVIVFGRDGLDGAEHQHAAPIGMCRGHLCFIVDDDVAKLLIYEKESA